MLTVAREYSWGMLWPPIPGSWRDHNDANYNHDEYSDLQNSSKKHSSGITTNHSSTGISIGSKSPGKRIPSRLPNGAPMKRDTHLQGIFTSLFIYLFISNSLRKERPSMFPRSEAPMETDPHSRALFNVSFGVPSKGALPSGPPHGPPSERDAPFPEPSFIHHSKAPVYEPLSWLQFSLGRKGTPMERDARIQSLF